MIWLKRAISAIRNLARWRHLDEDLDSEIHDFLAAAVDHKMNSGMSRDAAVRAANVEFGSVAAVKDHVRDVGWESVLSVLWRDIRYACRTLSKSRGFAIVAVTTMALGIGATTATFSIVEALLLRPLPYPEPERLVWAWGQRAGGVQRSAVNPQEFLDYRARSHAFSQFAAIAAFSQTATVTGIGDPIALKARLVSGNYLDALGVSALLGRTLHADDEQPGHTDVVVLSHAAWQQQFNGTPSIVGSTVRLDDRPVTIVGVMPRDFLPPLPAECWMPLPFSQIASNRRAHFMRPIGRLNAGVTIEQAQSQLNAIAQGLEREYPETSSGWSLRLVPLEMQLAGGLGRPFWLLFGAAFFLLLLACANVAGLLLARGASRAKEIAVRNAIGASRSRIVRQLLTESLLLAAAGSALGIALGLWILEGLIALNAVSSPSWAHITIDARVLAFAVPMTIATALLFGLLPALEATRVDLVETLKASSRTVRGGVRPRRLRAILVIGEVAATVILLIGGGLFMRSLITLRHVNPGFVTTDVVTFPIDLPQQRYRQPADIARFYEDLDERLAAIRGATAVGVVSELPLSDQMNDVPFVIEGRGVSGDDRTTADQRFVTRDYLRVMSIPTLRGRPFSDDEVRRSAPVTLISQRMVDRFFEGMNPIGQRLQMLGTTYEIIGIVGDVRHRSLATDAYPTVYVPSFVIPNGTVVLRIDGPSKGIGAEVRAVIRAIDKDLLLPAVRPLDSVLDRSLTQPLSNTMLLNTFAVVALGLALIGIYGIVSYTVSERTQEIGIRMALGATRADIETLIAGVGVKLAAVGCAIGLLGAMALSRTFGSLLFQVDPIDPITYVVIVTVLFATVFAACWFPARRAANIGSAAIRCD
jgi:putative ABC transport system permease protein